MRKFYYLVITLFIVAFIYSTSQRNNHYDIPKHDFIASDAINQNIQSLLFIKIFGTPLVEANIQGITPAIKFHSTVVGMNNTFYYETLDGQINSGFLNYFVMSFYLFISISLWMIVIMLIGKGIRKLFKMNPVVKFEDLKPLLDEIYQSNKARVENHKGLQWF